MELPFPDLKDNNDDTSVEYPAAAPIESSGEGWAIFGKFFVFAVVVASVVGYLRYRHTQKAKMAGYKKTLA